MKKGADKRTGKNDSSTEREQRLADALRANLRRRKAAQKSGPSASGGTSEKDSERES